MIKDSGNRTEFTTGAVRDIQKGKGRCDLLPLDVVAAYLSLENNKKHVLIALNNFILHDDIVYLRVALDKFKTVRGWDDFTMLLEVSIHFEEGAEKYGECNWQKGIHLQCYMNSAIRHYLKWLRGDTDEPHDRAFVWNILCAMWTKENIPGIEGKEE